MTPELAQDAPEVIGPQPGPQIAALKCPADLLVYGGEVGGGKTWFLDYDAGRWAPRLPMFGGIILRKISDELEGPGSLWETAQSLYPKMGARLVTSPYLEASWGNGSTISFRGCENDQSVLKHEGKSYGFIGIDEGQYWSEFAIWFLFGRLRSMTGMRPYMRITCNPDPDCYLRKLIDWWIGEDGLPIPERDGVIRWCLRLGEELTWFESEDDAWTHVYKLQEKDSDSSSLRHLRPVSVSFIRARLADNAKMAEKDPGYGSRVAMQDAVTRARKLDGNWNARATSGALFSPAWFQVLEQEPDPADVHFVVRGWDIAATKPSHENPDPDWTRGVKMIMLKSGLLVVADMVGHQDSPGATDNLIRATVMQDGPQVVQAFWQDPGSAGVRDVEHLQRTVWSALPSAEVRIECARKDKLSYASPYSARIDPRTRHNQFQISVVRGPWNSAYLSELRAFPSKETHDDVVDASSRAFMEIESQTVGYSAQWGAWLDGVTG